MEDRVDLALIGRLIQETAAEMKALRDEVRATITVAQQVERRMADFLDEMRAARCSA
jgi:hypothetical protein